MLHVITPTIPGRAELLAEAMASVQAQTHHGDPVGAYHHIGVDTRHQGPGAVRNRLARLAEPGDWLTFLDDDDIWYPHHLETLLDAMAEDRLPPVGVWYTLADIIGRDGWDPQQDTFDPARMRRANYIPLGGVAVRAELFHMVGGFPEDAVTYEDHHLFLRLLDQGVRFRCVPERTWAYRFGAWDSRSKEIWDGRRGKPGRAPHPAT